MTGRALMVVQHSHFLIISLYLGGVSTTSAGVSEWQSPGLRTGPEILDNPYQKDNHLVAETEQKLLEPNRYRGEHTGSVKRSISYVPETHHSIRQLDTNRLELSEHLRIELVESGVSFLEIRWRMENSTGHVLNVQPKLSRVRCYLGNATLLDKFNSTASRLRINNLLSSTRYTLCVEAVLDLPPSVMTHTRNDVDDDVVYSGCVSLSTIPLMRTDSIVALALTLGYVILLPLLGYVTWLLRVRRQATNRNSRQQAGLEMSSNGQTDARELSTIEERSHLTANFSRKPVSF